MQDLHARMLGTLLAGEGLAGVAELAAGEAGGPVAILLPDRGLAVASSEEVELDELTAAVARRLTGDEEAGEDTLADSEPVVVGDAPIGLVVALAGRRNGLPVPPVDRGEVLRTAALATLTEVAVLDARDEVAAEVRGSLLEDLRAGRGSADEVMRRAARLGCDLGRGAVALVAEIRSARPLHAAALIASEYDGAIAEPLVRSGGAAVAPARIYAILPARGADDAPERTADAARRLAGRLRAHGPVAFSSFCAQPAELRRAVAEAELMLGVIAVDDRIADQIADGIGDGVYRLLFRALASDPEEVRRFYAETVEPLVEHDREYGTDLLATLEAYLAHDCNMNATARAVYAHRHTVAHRLARVRELTGLDAALGEDRERLGLGIKAFRILAPTLPR
jgi:PucR family transcriptional regulator, purine catabolism regulatory protein